MRIPSLVAALSVILAAQVAAAEELRIAYVNMARALNDVEEGKAAKEGLKKDFEKKQKKLDAMQTELKKKKEDFDKQKSTMKPDSREQKQEELQKEFLELQQTYMNLQQELMGAESKATADIATKLRSVVNKIGDRDSLHLILDISDQVLYYKRHQDITDEIVKLYNQQYGKAK